RFSTFGEFLPEKVIPPLDYLLQEAFESGVAADAPLDLYVDPNAESDTPLLFPGKVLALPDGRVAIADSGHHRVVIATADGEVDDLIGAGIQGHVDGVFATAAFRRPQGMAWLNGLLYIADTENHLIREVDLEERTVVTVAGTGDKGVEWYSVTNSWQDAMTTALRSPWDLEVIDGDRFGVAMAGSHQLWIFEPDESRVRVMSGKKYSEGIVDGSASFAKLAQPSGLALSHDGQALYFADSESSAIREANVSDGYVTTLVGTGLFDYGDKDGIGNQVLLQHAVGVEILSTGNLVVADTYNDKLKHLNVETREVTTLDWGVPEPGLDEPRGLSRAGDLMYITDTNNHRVLRHDLTSGETVVFEMPDLDPPALGGFVAED
ncbi:MAG: hypothetical protein VX938_01970, partial [Myxococcota bacterium]|nr:hypothetical protein [Myxococcota bacterium]